MPVLDLTGNNWEEMAKRPRPTNEQLQNLFTGVDCILIKPGGSSSLYASPNPTLLEITRPDAIKQFATLIEIDEVNIGFHCMCLGTYDIELYAGNQLQATISYHHEVSIRYDGWSSDASLAHPEQLVHFMASIGFTTPLEDFHDSKRKQEASQLADAEWLAGAPKCFTTFWEEYQVDGNFPQALVDALNEEIPEKAARIIALLKTYGRSKSPWSGYPCYEDVPAEILYNYTIQYILEVYTNSDRNYKIRRGLARFLCSHKFRQIRKSRLKYISEEVINDLEKYYKSVNDEKGIYEINRLRKEKKMNSGK
jgi:hypothetical protein